MSVRVLYEDHHWLCVDKPAGVFTTPAADGRVTSLVELVRKHRPRATHHHPLSRLDADVTGTVLFALSTEATRLAAAARAEGRYERAYVGLAMPPPSPAVGVWTWPIAIDRRDRRKRTVHHGEAPQPAETRYTVEALAGPVAQVGFVPITGRTHQLRVHAHAAGCSLVGDGAYGGARRVVLDDGAVLAVARVMLHARRVTVPDLGRVVEAPWHDDMRALWVACGGT